MQKKLLLNEGPFVLGREVTPWAEGPVFWDTDGRTRWHILGNTVREAWPDDYSECREWKLSESGLHIQIPGRIQADEDLDHVPTSFHLLTEEDLPEAVGALSSKSLNWPAELCPDTPVSRRPDYSSKGYVGFRFVKPCLRLWLPQRRFAQQRHVTEVIVGACVEGTFYDPSSHTTGPKPCTRVACLVGRRAVELFCNVYGPPLKLAECGGLKQHTKQISSQWLQRAHQNPAAWKILFVRTNVSVDKQTQLVRQSRKSSKPRRKSSKSSPKQDASAGSDEGPITITLEDLDWVCSRCTLVNWGPVKRCQKCGAKRFKASNAEGTGTSGSAPNKWRCSACSSENTASAAKCRSCGQAAALGAAQPTSKQLTSASCTVTSPATDLQCKVCGTKLIIDEKTQPNDAYGKTARLWACPACALENPESANVCITCGFEVPAGELARDTESQTSPPCVSGHVRVEHTELDPGAGFTASHWACSVCTLVNTGDTGQCKTCATERFTAAAAKLDKHVDQLGWCSKCCTLQKAEELFACEVSKGGTPDLNKWTHGPLVDPLLERLPVRPKKVKSKCKLQNDIEQGKLGKQLLDYLGKNRAVQNGVFELFEKHNLLEKADLTSGAECYQIVWALKECAPLFRDDSAWTVFAWLVSVMVSNNSLRKAWAREKGDETEADRQPYVPVAYLGEYLSKLWPTVGASDRTFLSDAAARLDRGKSWQYSISLDEMKGLFVPARGRFIITEKCILNGDLKFALFFLRRTSSDILRARWEIPDLVDRTMPQASFFLLYNHFRNSQDHDVAGEFVNCLAKAYVDARADPSDALKAFVERADVPKQHKRDFLIAFVSSCRMEEGQQVNSALAQVSKKKQHPFFPLRKRTAKPGSTPSFSPATNITGKMSELVVEILLNTLASGSSLGDDDYIDDCKELLEAALMLGDGNSFSPEWAKRLSPDQASRLKEFLSQDGAKYIGLLLKVAAGITYCIREDDTAPSFREIQQLLDDKVSWTHDHFDSHYFSERLLAPRSYKDIAQLLRMFFKLDFSLGNIALWTCVQEMERESPAFIGTFNKLAPEFKILRSAIIVDVHTVLCPKLAKEDLQTLLSFSSFFDPTVQTFIQAASFKEMETGIDGATRDVIFKAILKVMSLVGCKNEQSCEDVCLAIVNLAKSSHISCQFICRMCQMVLSRSWGDFVGVNGENGFNSSSLQECARRLQVACEVIEYKVKAGRVKKEQFLKHVLGVVHSLLKSPPYMWESSFGSLDTIIFLIEYMGKEDLHLTYEKLEDDLNMALSKDLNDADRQNIKQLKELLNCVKQIYTKPMLKVSADSLVSMQQLNITDYIKQNAPKMTEVVNWNGVSFTPADWEDILEIVGTTARAMQEKFSVLMLPHHTQIISLVMFAIRSCAVSAERNSNEGQLPLTMLARVGTGEGKSWVIGMLAAFIARRGQRLKKGLRAHVVIDNATLKSRDFHTVSMFFEKLNITASESEEHLTSQDHKIVYCIGAEIWSQCRKRQEAGDQHGFEEGLRNAILIVDEVDGLIIDGEPNIPYMYPDQGMTILADQWLRQLENDIQPVVTQEGEADPIITEENQLCLERVLEAYEEAKSAVKGKDFDWRGGNMYMIDKKTGMLQVGFWDLWFEIRHWIEKEWDGWVTYKCIKGVLSKKHCFTAYPCIFGLTGSLGQRAEKEYLASQYKAVTFNVPYFLETCREEGVVDSSKPKVKNLNVGDVVQRNADAQMDKVIALAVAKCKNVPVLIIARDVAKVEEVAKRLEQALGDVRHGSVANGEDSVLLGRERVIRLIEMPGQPQRFVKLVDLAMQPWDLGDSKGQGKSWRVTVTTAEGGRGHDYRVVDPSVDAAGGMLLILMWVSWSEREWIQFLGRTSRQDHEGQYAVYLDGEAEQVVQLETSGKDISQDDKVVDMILAAGDDKMKTKLSGITHDIQRGTLMHRLTARYWGQFNHATSTTPLQECVWRRLCREYLQTKHNEKSIIETFNSCFPGVSKESLTHKKKESRGAVVAIETNRYSL